MAHFHDRCRERGIVKTDPETLRQGIALAIENGRNDLVEKVTTNGHGATFWRFKCPDGIFYAITTEESGVNLTTVITQGMMRRAKFLANEKKAGYRRKRLKNWHKRQKL